MPSKDSDSTSRDLKVKKILKQLEDSLSKELFNVRSEIDKEKEKQLSLIERKLKKLLMISTYLKNETL